MQLTALAWACGIALAGRALAQTPLPKAEVDHQALASVQTNAAAGASDSTSLVRVLEARLAEARVQLAAIEQMGPTNAPVGVSSQDMSRRRAFGDRLVRLYEQQLSNTSELATIRNRKDGLAREARAWTRFSEPPPYSILLTDRLREELQAARLKAKASEAGMSILNALIEENRDVLNLAEEAMRQIHERLEGADDAVLAVRLGWQRDLGRLRSQVAAATIAVLDSERSLRQEELAEARLLLDFRQRQLVFAEAGAKFTQADFDQVTTRLGREHEELANELAAAEVQRITVQRALDAARQEAVVAKERAVSPGSLARAEAALSAREAQLETADAAIRGLRLMLEGANVERTIWELRYAGYDSRDISTLAQAERRLESFARRLDLWRDQVRQQLEVTSTLIQLQTARLQDLAAEADLHPIGREHLDTLRERDQSLLRVLRTLDRLGRLTQRVEESLHAAESHLPLTGRLQRLFSSTRSFFEHFWDFELFTAEDTITVDGQKITGKRSVTVGKIVMALFILVAGVWIIGKITALVEPFIVRRFKIEANQAGLIRRWLRALMVVCLVLFSLASVKIPLTVFAFAGGALAIGLGFGTQTMLKNLVSGLILLFERPFQVGDVLDVGGQKGTVTSVGLRASVLQQWDGTETLIPNSSLLENNVTNWTYSNRKVRFPIQVGVAYGTDTRRVMQLLHEVAERHGLIEKEPKPQVLFTDFGESTLAFELRFWVDVGRVNVAQVSSDLRVMIAGSFAEHGIAIAYPQRDVHLHAEHPLRVQMVPPPPGSEDRAKEPDRAEGDDRAARTP